MQDQVIAKAKWEFDEEVTSCFENMLERSIPAYADMRDLSTRIGKKFVKDKTAIIDIGCSTGEAIKPFIQAFGARNSYKLYDVSQPMLQECRRRYKSWTEIGVMEIEDFDIRNGLEKHINASLVLSILTIQFVPIEYRQKIIQSIYDRLVSGGAFIFVEKVLGNDYLLDKSFVDEYLKIKKENAYTEEQINAKRKSLEGVLVPITAKWNEDLLKNAGFKSVDCFYRYLNFSGWIAVK